MDEPLATSPDDADHLRALVDAALVPLFGGLPEHDSDDDVPVVNGSGLVWVRVLENAPVVQLFSALVTTSPISSGPRSRWRCSTGTCSS